MTVTNQLVECIPNFSEGRRPEVIEAIKDAITQVNGVSLLDQHTDKDHNRTVLTFSGPPRDVLAAAFAGITSAAELIDLEQHQGEHPRIGATDVVPFVPLSGISIEECVDLAVELAQRVGSELNIPVFLYEAAATRPERKNLENIRRGEYEGMKERIQSDPSMEPDFGPNQLGSAGATVIGARHPLIAFNVYLATDEVEIAKAIAKRIRFSSGGLEHVKALGLLVEGRAQVSMNLTNFRKTSIATVVELIRSEAERHDTQVHSSELVGLIPQEALLEAAQYYLEMDQFEFDQVLETRLHAAEEKKRSHAASFLDQLAAGSATPGGGAAAAYAGAMGASLVAMVSKLSIGKDKYREIESRMKEILLEIEAIKTDLEIAVQEDALAFEKVMQAYKLPKETEEERALRVQAIELAMQGAVDVPFRVARLSARTNELALELVREGNLNAISDAGTAGAMASAAVRSAAMNVRINANSLPESEKTKIWLEEIASIEKQIEAATSAMNSALEGRGGI